ncbi:MAG: hypothetical protein GF409_05050 [Candidatus Omnitrophica bacterium]|nr:hypothetical protein [Candidatus Omnitrophota bacterium]
MRETLARIRKKLIPADYPYRYLIPAGIVYFLFLCAVHYASGRPLWLDERSILENITLLSPLELLGPLRHSQAFPHLYLFIVQTVSKAFEYNVYALRLVPFVLMALAFFTWLRLFRKEEGTNLNYMLFILAWCGSNLMSYYSAELKQYSGDVLIAALFAIFIIDQRSDLKHENFRPATAVKYLFMPALVLLSYTANFFVLIPLYNLLLNLRENRKTWPYLLIYTFSVGVFAGLSYYYDARYARVVEDFPVYWNDYFILTSSFSDFIQSFSEGFRNIFVRWFVETSLIRRIMTVFMPFAVYFVFVRGFKRFREDRFKLLSLRSIIAAVLIGMMIAGITKCYPFTGTRVTLFIAPFIFYSIIKGIELCRGRYRWLYKGLLTLYVATLVSTSIYILIKYVALY